MIKSIEADKKKHQMLLPGEEVDKAHYFPTAKSLIVSASQDLSKPYRNYLVVTRELSFLDKGMYKSPIHAKARDTQMEISLSGLHNTKNDITAPITDTSSTHFQFVFPVSRISREILAVNKVRNINQPPTYTGN